MKSLAIEREFGSGGREIGMRVAELAGIPYYDGELLIKAAEAQGVSIELLKTYDEQRTGSFLYDIAAFSDYARNRKNTVYELFEGIRRTMVNIELKGPAVFIGSDPAVDLFRPRPQRCERRAGILRCGINSIPLSFYGFIQRFGRKPGSRQHTENTGTGGKAFFSPSRLYGMHGIHGVYRWISGRCKNDSVAPGAETD